MIVFNWEGVNQPDFFEAEKSRQWLQQLAIHHESVILKLNYIFCSDDYLFGINKKFLNHDYYTDIITFPYRQGKLLESDIFISLDRVSDNASDFDTDMQTELLRVMAHGLLHLIGFKDKEDADAEKMREEEEKALLLYGSL